MPQHVVPLPTEVAIVPREEWDQQRVAPRYHCAPATPAQIVIASQSSEVHRGWVLDLSARGAGMLLPKALPADTLILVQVKSNDGQRSYSLPGRVVHATTQPTGDWLVGCEFAEPLTSDDLEALL
jgi:hypothetical protein